MGAVGFFKAAHSRSGRSEVKTLLGNLMIQFALPLALLAFLAIAGVGFPRATIRLPDCFSIARKTTDRAVPAVSCSSFQAWSARVRSRLLFRAALSSRVSARTSERSSSSSIRVAPPALYRFRCPRVSHCLIVHGDNFKMPAASCTVR